MRSILPVFRLNHLLNLLQFTLALVLQLLLEPFFDHLHLFFFIWQNCRLILITVMLDWLSLSYELIVDTIVQLAVIIVLVLSISLSDSLSHYHAIIVYQGFNWQMKVRKMSFGRVERSEDDWLGRTVFDQWVVSGVELVLGEVLVSVQPGCVVVCEFFANNVFLCFSEYVQILRGVFQPDMLEYLLRTYPLCWICLQNLPQQIPGLNTNVILQSIFPLDDKLMQLTHVLSLERHRPVEHWV